MSKRKHVARAAREVSLLVRRWRMTYQQHLERLARIGALAAALGTALPIPAGAQETVAANPLPAHRYVQGDSWAMVRFEFDNDTWLGSDDAFSAGWSLQLHSALEDTWHDPLGKIVGKLPGMHDDGEGGRVVRRSFGLSQLIITPEELTIEELQPDDAPYAGVLGIHGSWAAYDNRRLLALQLYVGCLGPCSQAEQVQKFVHDDLGHGTHPEGWDNQLEEEWLGNVNVAWRRKLLASPDERYSSRAWASDLSLGGQLAVGNAAQFVDAQLEYRLGWGLPMGFTHIPDPAPRGVVLDPAYVSVDAWRTGATDWRGYLSIVLRAMAEDEIVVREGGRTENGGYHPGFDANEDEPEVLVGIHLGKGGWAAHLTYYRFLGSRVDQGPGSSTDWINISFERRF